MLRENEKNVFYKIEDKLYQYICFANLWRYLDDTNFKFNFSIIIPSVDDTLINVIVNEINNIIDCASISKEDEPNVGKGFVFINGTLEAEREFPYIYLINIDISKIIDKKVDTLLFIKVITTLTRYITEVGEKFDKMLIQSIKMFNKDNSKCIISHLLDLHFDEKYRGNYSNSLYNSNHTLVNGDVDDYNNFSIIKSDDKKCGVKFKFNNDITLFMGGIRYIHEYFKQFKI